MWIAWHLNVSNKLMENIFEATTESNVSITFSLLKFISHLSLQKGKWGEISVQMMQRNSIKPKENNQVWSKQEFIILVSCVKTASLEERVLLKIIHLAYWQRFNSKCDTKEAGEWKQSRHSWTSEKINRTQYLVDVTAEHCGKKISNTLNDKYHIFSYLWELIYTASIETSWVTYYLVFWNFCFVESYHSNKNTPYFPQY